jgi:uncharacterized protein
MGMRKALDLCYKISVSHPKITLFISSVLLVIALISLPHLQTELRIYDVQDKNFPSTQALREMKESFKDKNSVIMLFANKNHSPLTGPEYCDIRDWVLNTEKTTPQLLGAFGPYSLRKPLFKNSHLWYPDLIQVSCKPGKSGLQNENPMTILKDTPWLGTLTDFNLKDMAVEFNFDDTPNANHYGKFDPAPIGQLLSRIQNEIVATHPGLEVYMGGRAAFQWHYKELLAKDGRVNVVVIFVLLLLCRLLFGRWRAGIYLVFTLIVSAIFLFGLMALAGSPVDMLTNSLFLMMCVATLEDFIFLSNLHQRNPDSWKNNFKDLIVPSLLTSTTTIVGFGSLMISDIGIIRRLGFWGALSAVLEWAVVFFVLPAVFQVFKINGNWTSKKKSLGWNFISRAASYKLPRAGIFFAIILVLVSFSGIFHLNFNDSPRSYFSKDHMHRRTYDYLRVTRHWEGSIEVLFDSDDQNSNKAILEKIANYKNTSKVDDPYSIENFLIKDLSSTVSNLVLREFSDTASYDHYYSSEGKMRSTVFIKSIDLKAINETIDFIRDVCGTKCSPVGEGVAYAEYTGQVVTTLYKSFILTLILIGLIIFFLCRSLKVGRPWKILLSVYWSPIIMIGVISLLQIPINLITCIFASVYAGLAGDNAIQFLFASSNSALKSGTEKRGGGAIQVAMVSALTSLSFLGLTLLPMRTLGVLLFFGFFLALTGDLWLLNGLISNDK